MWDAAQPKLAMADNVRAALLLVSRGEAALGIVYATDAKVEPGVKIIGAFPDGFASADHLSGCGNHHRETRSDRYLTFLRGEGRTGYVREIRLHDARCQAVDLIANVAQVVACSNSLQKNGRRSGCRCGSPSSRRWSRCRSASRMAWLLARKSFPGKALLDGLIVLPLVLPPVVTGYLLLISFGRRGPVGSFLYETFGIVLSFRWTGAALACGIMAFPLLVRPIRISFEAIDRKLEDAAATLGARSVLALRHGDAAARDAGDHRRHAALLRQGAGRIRRHHHLRVQYPGRDTDDLGRDLHLYADAGR